jgi:methylisocitrate lyase
MGTQRSVIDMMQTCEDLYDRIGYHAFEQRLDGIFANDKA